MKTSFHKILALLLAVLVTLISLPLIFFAVAESGDYTGGDIDPVTGEPVICKHTKTTVYEAVAPTCIEPGNAAYTKCDECGVIISGDATPIPATGIHTVGDWLHNGDGHWHYCTVCEQNVDTAAHTLTWVVVTPATLEADGLKKEVCSVCGYETGNTEVLNKLENHKPGDINDDGVVNNKDLTRLFQKLSGLNVKVNDAALDVNGDGKENNKDITTLFKYLSGWDNITLS